MKLHQAVWNLNQISTRSLKSGQTNQWNRTLAIFQGALMPARLSQQDCENVRGAPQGACSNTAAKPGWTRESAPTIFLQTGIVTLWERMEGQERESRADGALCRTTHWSI